MVKQIDKYTSFGDRVNNESSFFGLRMLRMLKI
jgi:hypothetical protein